MLYKKFIVLNLLYVPLIHPGKSHGEAIFPIIAALQCAQQRFLSDKEEHAWHSTNEKQKLLINTYLQHTKDLAKISPNEFSVCVSCESDEINTFLKERACEASIRTFKGSHALGIASLINIGGLWKDKGEADFIEYNREWYNAIAMSNKDMYKVIQMYDYNYPIVTIATQHGDTVSITIADKIYSGFELLDIIEKIIHGIEAQEITNDYVGIKFPMVDLTYKPNLFWLVGMSKHDKKGEHKISIEEVFQEIIFKMDHIGFVAKSEPIFQSIPQGTRIDNEEKFFVINKPFFVWIERKDIRLPLFAGYIDAEDWKKPKR